MTKYWVVRAGWDIQDIVERDGFIGIGFGGDALGDLSGLSMEEIRPRVENAPDRRDKKAGYYTRAAGQLWQFINEIEEGDCLLTPHRRTRNVRNVRIGLVRGAYEFSRGAPRPHRRPVEWIRTDILRDGLSAQLRASLTGRMTVFSVNRHADELEANITDAIRCALEFR